MLRNLQNDFKKFVETGELTSDLANEVLPTELDEKHRLGIYRNSVKENIKGALKIAYPNTIKLVGEEFFEYVASAYIFKNLPQEGNLLNYGDTFSEYLASINETSKYPFIYDFAKLEWYVNECHNAEVEYAVTASDVDRMLHEGRTPEFKLRSCLRVIASNYAIEDLWGILLSNKELPENFKIDLPSELYTLLMKIDHGVEFFPLEKEEYQIVSEMLNGKELADALGFLKSEEKAGYVMAKLLNIGVFRL